MKKIKPPKTNEIPTEEACEVKETQNKHFSLSKCFVCYLSTFSYYFKRAYLDSWNPVSLRMLTLWSHQKASQNLKNHRRRKYTIWNQNNHFYINKTVPTNKKPFRIERESIRCNEVSIWIWIQIDCQNKASLANERNQQQSILDWIGTRCWK